MVVLEVEAENDDKDGRVEACGACEAVLACVGGVCGWVWRWADGAGDGWAYPHKRAVDGRRRGEEVRVEFPVCNLERASEAPAAGGIQVRFEVTVTQGGDGSQTATSYS